MYYNIKIKFKGSEFVLESENKSITQREMDIYFANIFEVSDEFKSQIKKVVIQKENLKSINDFNNNINTSPVIKNVEQQVKQNVLTPKTQENQIAIQNNIQEQTEVKPNTSEVFDLAQFTKNNEFKETPVTETEKVEIIDNTSLEEMGIKSEIDKILGRTQENNSKLEIMPGVQIECLNEKQEKIDSSATFSESSNTLKPIETVETIKEESKEVAIDNNVTTVDSQDTFVDIENVIDVTSEDIIDKSTNVNLEQNNESVQINSQTQDELDEFDYSEYLEEPKKDEVDKIEEQKTNSLDNILNLMQKEFDAVNLNSDKQNSVEQKREVELQEEKSTSETLAENLNNVQTLQTEGTSAAETVQSNAQPEDIKTMDFLSYKNRYNIIEIEDEFLACASYFKNVLNQPNFTIKGINTKLYPVVQKIADLAVVQNLLDKQHISIILGQEMNYYAITETGEAYINTRLFN